MARPADPGEIPVRKPAPLRWVGDPAMYRPAEPDGIRTIDPVGVTVHLNAGKRYTRYKVRGVQVGVADDYADDDDRRFIWVAYGDARTARWNDDGSYAGQVDARVFWMPEGPGIKPTEVEMAALEGQDGLAAAKRICERALRPGARREPEARSPHETPRGGQRDAEGRWKPREPAQTRGHPTTRA